MVICTQYDVQDGLRFANAAALIPLKARAWLDLTRRRTAGETIHSDDITKHRTDVFRLAIALPPAPGPGLAETVTADLLVFLEHFRPDAADWSSILSSLRSTLGGKFEPHSLRSAVQTYFHLPPS